MNLANLLFRLRTVQRCDLLSASKHALSSLILLSALIGISLHLWPEVFSISFGFDGWQTITGQGTSIWTIIASIIMALAIFLVSVAWSRDHKRLRWSRLKQWASSPSARGIASMLLWLLAAVVFWVFRTSVVLGDGNELADVLADPSSFPQPRWYLANLIVKGVSLTLGSLFSLSWMESIRLCSVLAGATTVVVLIRIVRCLFAEPRRQWLFLGLLPSAYGLIQLWFGYPEIYSVIALGWAVLIWVYLLVIAQKLPFAFASFLSGLVYLFYIGNILILPGYVLLAAIAIRRLPGWPNRIKHLALNLVILLCTIGLCLSWKYGADFTQFWSAQVANANIGKGHSPNSIFYPIDYLLNGQHLVEFANEWILVDAAGMLLTLLAPLLWILSHQDWSPIQYARAGILAAITVPYIAYSFLMEPLLGYPRDWDLFSYLGLFTFLFGGYVFLGQQSVPSMKWAYRALVTGGVVHLMVMLIPFLTFSGVLSLTETAVWIDQNAVSRHLFLAPLLYQNSAIVQLVHTSQFKSFESRDTIVLPSNADGKDAVYLFPLEQEKKVQTLAARLGSLGAREQWTWRSLPWLYRVPAKNLPDLQNPLPALLRGGDFVKPAKIQHAMWEDGIELLGYSVNAEGSAGRNLTVTLFLHSLDSITRNYTFSIKAHDSKGRVWGQEDKWPGDNSYETTRWSAGDVVIEKFYPGLTPCAPADEYRITVEGYDSKTTQALALADGRGNMVELGTVRAGEPQSFRLQDLEPDQVLNDEVAPQVRLAGFSLTPDQVRADDSISLALFWSGVGNNPTSHRITVSLRDTSDHEFVLAEKDVPIPVAGRGLCTQFDLLPPREASPGQGSILVDGARVANISILQ